MNGIDKISNRVYTSEDQTAMRMPPQPSMSLEEVAEFVEAITRKEWWLRRSWFLQVIIRDGRGSADALAHMNDGIINLPKWARKRFLVVHELTHLITNVETEPHGPEFAANLRDMYQRFLGNRWADILEDRFEHNKVEWLNIPYRNRFNIVRPTYSVPRARKPLLVKYR